jgi:hypothetical protein
VDIIKRLRQRVADLSNLWHKAAELDRLKHRLVAELQNLKKSLPSMPGWPTPDKVKSWNEAIDAAIAKVVLTIKEEQDK